MSTTETWPGVELLAEPTRRLVYEQVRLADRPLTRDEVADAAAISGRLAAFHLERLVAGGLLEFDYARPAGVGGPGAGRPAKRYWPAEVTLSVVVPPRRFELAARLLAATVADAPPAVVDSAVQRATTAGTELGQVLAKRSGRRTNEQVLAASCLTEMGYEPRERDGRIALKNCPFHEVVDSARDVVCALNFGLISGALAGAGVRRLSAQRVPAPPGCCVEVVPAGRRPGKPARPGLRSPRDR